MKSQVVVVFLIFLSVAMLACSVSGATQPSPPAATPEPAKGKQPALTPVPTKPGSAATAAPGSTEDKPLSLSSRQAGLDKLKSYRIKWQAEWKGTEAGSTQTVNWNWLEEFSSDPKGLHWVWQMTDSQQTSKSVNMEWWQIGDTTYMLTKDASGKGECLSFSSDDPNNQLTKGLFSPNTLGSVQNAKYVGAETVNGVKTRHYKYDEKAVTVFASGKVNGDIWVATEGDFVVKETMNWSGVPGLFGLGTSTKGDGKWLWELTDINRPVTIKAPDNCGGQAADIPVMKDATEKSRFGNMLTYKTAAKIADVVAFYKKELAAAGWKIEDDGLSTDQMAQLSFVKGDQELQIIITTESGKTNVLITIK